VDAVIYTRVSRDAKGERVSVQSQERECRAVCERNAWPVRAVYCDNSIGASRFSADRPEWKRLKADLRQGEVLVVWESSRAQRDLEEFITLRNLCAEKDVRLSYQGRVLNLSEGDDRFTGGLDALLAERESEYIRKRVLRGKLDAAEAGKPATRPPWGYRRVGVGEWEPDPDEAPRVREAAERLLAGETQYAVFEWLKATEGYAPTTPTTLRRALLNPALAGLRQHQGEVVGKASWPAIITTEQHEQLKSRDRRMKALHGFSSQPGPEPRHLLSGIAKCGVCDEGLRYRAQEGRKPYYDCRKGHVSRLADMLDKAVEDEIFKRLSAVDPSDYESDDADDSAVIAEIEELERQLAEWEAEAIAGQVSPGAFGRAERDLTARIEALRGKIETPSELELDPAQWPELTMSERRYIVRSLVDVVVPKLARRVRALPGDVRITPI
jgi:site-specific DNA recombinase